jgi:hypothetical protein
MNAPHVEELLVVNDLFAALINVLTRSVMAQLEPRLAALEKDSTEAANKLHELYAAKDDSVLTEERVKELIDDKLQDYDPTDARYFDDRVKEIMNEHNVERIEKVVKEFIENNVRVNLDVD